MKTITIHTASTYNVYVGAGLMTHLSDFLSSNIPGQKVVIVSDSNVWPLYGNQMQEQLNLLGFSTFHYVFPAGEQQKCIDTYLAITEYLASIHFTRADLLIALGGGVVGDLAGFVAATYLRGVAYIQVPTSLLAMVDSSVGGKTAIDLSVGKNLIGAFYQPNLVICDTSALSTLPPEIFRDGCAEVIKYGILFDNALFSHLESCGLEFDTEYVVSRCIELKRDIVSMDEFDRGERQKLNLGHTFGHGIEARSNFSISHGQAVAMGTAIVSKVSKHMGYCDVHTASRIENLLRKFTFTLASPYSSEEICPYVLSDKKRNGSYINLILPEEIGKCITVSFPVNEIPSIIKAGL